MELIKKHLIFSATLLFTSIVAISISMDIKVSNQHSILNEAFIEVLKSSSKTFRSLNLIVYDDNGNNDSQIGEILEKIENLSVQIISIRGANLNSQYERIKILEKSVTSFLFRSKIELILFDGRWEMFSRYVLLLFDFQIEFSYLTKIFDTFESLHCSNINIITFNNAGEIVMYSCILFSIHNRECRSKNPVVVNFYNDSQHEWSNYDIFSLSRLRNFHGCPVSFATTIYPPKTLFKHKDKNFTRHIDDYDGSEIEIIKGLSHALNFTVDLQFVTDYYDFGGALSRVHEVDGVFGFFYLNQERHKILSHVYP